MKVILLQDVAKIGRRSQIVEVPDGYALNQLIPKKMAEPATAANQKRIERLQAEAAAHKQADNERFSDAVETLKTTKVQIVADTNELGHLFKAVSESDIALAAKEAGVHIEASMVKVSAPVKDVGEHTVTLALGGQKAEFIIEVSKK